jgi:hypothetical protein
MVISDINQVVYNGDGQNTAFPFTFAISKASDVHLLLIRADGTEQEVSSDFYVDVNTNTAYYPGYAPGAEPGQSDQPPKLQAGEKLIVYRALPVTQERNLGDKHPFNPIERALDKLTMLLQQIWGVWDRCLKISVGTAATRDMNLTVPLQAGKSFRVNDEGTGFEVTEDPAVAMQAAQISATLATSAKQAAEEAQAAAEQSAAIAVTAAIKNYDNVAAMKADTHVFAGAKAITSGYYSANDGGGGNYIVRAKTAEDVEDNGSIHFLQNNLVAELVATRANVKQFGAKGDNTHDDTVAIQTAVDYCTGRAGGTVYFPEGDYKVSDTICINASNIKVAGAGKCRAILRPTPDLIIDANNLNVKWTLFVENTNPVVSTELTGTIARSALSMTVANGAGIKAGMLAYIKGSFDTSPWSCDNRGSAVKGETNEVKSVNGNTINLNFPAFTNFSNSENVIVEFVEPLRGIEISNIGISCPEGCAVDARQYRGFGLKGCIDASIHDCYGCGCGMSCLESMSSVKSTLYGNQVDEAYAYYPGTSTIYGLGYGLRCSDDSLSSIVNNRGENARHCVDISGDYPSHGILVSGNIFRSAISDYGVLSTHGPAEGCTFTNNVVAGNNYAICVRGENILVKNNTFFGSIMETFGRNNAYESNYVDGAMSICNPDMDAVDNYLLVKNNIFKFSGAYHYLKKNTNTNTPFSLFRNLTYVGNLHIYTAVMQNQGVFDISYTGSPTITFERLVWRDNYIRLADNNGTVKSTILKDMSKVIMNNSEWTPFVSDNQVSINPYEGYLLGDTCYRRRQKRPVWFDGERWLTADGRLSTDNASSVPTKGNYKRGDIVWNSAPTPGGFLGWICVATGTPGTWKGFGTIES